MNDKTHVHCPETDCPVSGTIPGIKRHLTSTHGLTKDVRDERVKTLQIVEATAETHWTSQATSNEMLAWLRENGRFLAKTTPDADLIKAIKSREAKVAGTPTLRLVSNA